MEKKNFNEVLKKQEQDADIQLKERQGIDEEMTLDDTQRVKVLSPGRLVFNRFIRNKLSIVGSLVLIFMFVFSFICPLFYPYSQTEIFYKYDKVRVNYSQASMRDEFSTIMLGDAVIDNSIKNRLNGYIREMEEEGLSEFKVTDDNGIGYVINKKLDQVYVLGQNEVIKICSLSGTEKIGTYNHMFKKINLNDGQSFDDSFAEVIEKTINDGKSQFSFNQEKFQLTAGKKGNYTIEKEGGSIEYVDAPMGNSFENAIASNIENKGFVFNDKNYTIGSENGKLVVYEAGPQKEVAYLTTYVFDAFSKESLITDEFRKEVISAFLGNNSFTMDKKQFLVQNEEEEVVVYDKANLEQPYVALSTVAVRAFNGEDTMEFSYKEKVREVAENMLKNDKTEDSFEWEIPQLDENGEYEYDENGNILKENTIMKIVNKNGTFTISCDQVNYLIDIYASPSKEHWIGTDGDGMDVLSRMMYGGRVSLLVCFVVVILETVLGVIMGGIAGYFGGMIDNIIMRMVDIFYCIPSMPILIITGALFDAQKLSPYVRLIWMMVILGVLGWAGVARLVRGQILSLREQEFMVAAESIGLKTSRRIFKHLVPNVMPQLIVTASSALGSIIITESTLSFLGLGVKHPLATWGTMINSVTSSSENMIRYTYIWIPVGLLICLTVIAFNFVGDGLRDAFDPKMKR